MAENPDTEIRCCGESARVARDHSLCLGTRLPHILRYYSKAFLNAILRVHFPLHRDIATIIDFELDLDSPGVFHSMSSFGSQLRLLANKAHIKSCVG